MAASECNKWVLEPEFDFKVHDFLPTPHILDTDCWLVWWCPVQLIVPSIEINSDVCVGIWCVPAVQIPGITIGCGWGVTETSQEFCMGRGRGGPTELNQTGVYRNPRSLARRDPVSGLQRTISHNLTFHSILVSKGDALWSQPKVWRTTYVSATCLFSLLHSMKGDLLFSILHS